MAIVETKAAPVVRRKIDARQAAGLAMEYCRELFSNDLASSLTLEEVEFSEEENRWLITLSFQSKEKTPQASMASIFGAGQVTKYKVFKVDARTGKIHSMKIRKFE